MEPLIAICTAKFGDYQWIKVKSTTFKNPNSVGQAISRHLPQSDIIESTSVAGPGFVNVVLSSKWVAKNIQNMLLNGIGAWAPILSVERAVVDFSSPNIAKEMHVGYLRSTIIGDTLSRMLEFSNIDVLRRNHVGDWGTQFGMLIEHLFDNFPNWNNAGEQAIGEICRNFTKHLSGDLTMILHLCKGRNTQWFACRVGKIGITMPGRRFVK